MKTALAIGLCMALGAVLWLVGSPASETDELVPTPDTTPTDLSKGVHRSKDGSSSVRTAEHPAGRAEQRSQSDAAANHVPTRLPPTKVRLVRRQLISVIGSLSDQLAEHQKGFPEGGTTSDLLEHLQEEASIRMAIESRHAALGMLASERYSLLSSDAKTPSIEKGVRHLRLRYGLRVDNQAVDPVFALSLKDHPSLQGAMVNYHNYVEWMEELRVQAFNALPYEQRKKRYEGHVAAAKALAELNTRRDLPDEELVRMRRDLRKAMFPANLLVSKGSYLMQRRTPKKRDF